MKSYSSIIRVRYAETDQMGVVHHGNYAQYLELARIEWMEQFGISYKSMENDGVMLPVYEMKFKFKRPAHFDDYLTIQTTLIESPGFRIKFNYKIYREEELLTTAETTLVFMDAKTKKPISCPTHILKAIGF
ncbi:acyl-CoA thioesterase [Mesonia aestuariivivens]|uniref:Acyl-CoA thioesterase n=1 Tax=Mesonia aestuariivivens TaxID=2796128 RepID=A0ABS6W056_9FLAO|nr:thioesterase family protein [Mesonia aestuariivivens]MBW2961207.1 acyl-CoA thioesterase [Mesonia aestuariivivens]